MPVTDVARFPRPARRSIVTPGCQRPSCVLCHPVTVPSRRCRRAPVFSAGWSAARDLRMLSPQQADQAQTSRTRRCTERLAAATPAAPTEATCPTTGQSPLAQVSPLPVHQSHQGQARGNGAPRRVDDPRARSTSGRSPTRVDASCLVFPKADPTQSPPSLVTTTAGAVLLESVATAQAAAAAGRARAPSRPDAA